MTAVKCRPRWDLLALLLVVVLVNARALLNPAFIPQHDTFLHTMVFHHAYSHLYFHGELAHWFPNVSFGVPTLLWNAVVFTPSDYAAMLLGLLFGVRDVALLQKLAIVCDQLVFVVGMYAVARRWFQHRATVLFVCLAAAAMPVWYANVGHALRIFYLYPFFLLALWQFYESGRPVYFWWTGGLVFLALIGNAQYAVALYALSLTAFLLVLVRQRPSLVRALLTPTRTNALGLLLVLALAGGFWAVTTSSRTDLDIVTPGRNPDGSTSLDSFLRFDGFDRYIPLAVYTLGAPVFTELNFYVGLLPWALLLWALIHVRSPGFAAAVVPLFVLLGIAFSDTLATLFYYGFPLVRYFKPIQYVSSVANVFLLLSAGYGLDSFLEANRRRQFYFGAGCVALASLLGVQLAAQADLLPGLHFHLARVTLSPWGNGIWLWLRLGAYALGLAALAWLGGRLSETRARLLAPVLLIGCLAVDLGLYVFLAGQPDDRQALPAADAALVRPLAYVPERAGAYHFTRLPSPPSSIYDIQYQFEEIDPCLPQNRSLVFPAGVRELLAVRPPPEFKKSYYYVDAPGRTALLETRLGVALPDRALADVLGCTAPKLRVVGSARLAAPAEARRLVAGLPDIDRVVVLSADRATTEIMDSPQEAAGPVRVEAFNANGLTVAADVPGDAPRWLVYADAYHPGWTVRVNGRPQAVLPANLGFKAVELAPGSNRIEWRFGGVWVWFNNGLMALGAATWLVGMAGLAVYLCNPERRRAAATPPPEPPPSSAAPSATP